jgi:hypothetical protein
VCVGHWIDLSLWLAGFIPLVHLCPQYNPGLSQFVNGN